MRFLANENVPLSAVNALREMGHDAAWIREDEPGAADQRVLQRALDESRILLTFDRDFGELVFARGSRASPGVVLFRHVGRSADETAAFVVKTLLARSDWEGNFSVVEADRVRMRALPNG